MENLVFPCVDIHISYIMCVCVLKVHNPGVYGIFYGLDLKKEMVVLENNPLRSLDVLVVGGARLSFTADI